MRLQTLERGLTLLEWVASHPDEATARSVAQALGLNITTCYHLVNTLLAKGYLVKGGRGALHLGPAVPALCLTFNHQARPEAILKGVVEDLVEATRETTHLSIWDGGDVMLLFSLEGPQHLKVSGLAPGFRGFAHCRTSGKAILAFLGEDGVARYLAIHELAPRTPNSITDPQRLRAELSEIFERGIAYDVEEFEVGIFGVGAPFFDASGSVAGALVVDVPSSRAGAALDSVSEFVLEAAERASRLLGYAGPYPPRASDAELGTR